MAELALNDVERHAFAQQFQGVRVAQLVPESRAPKDSDQSPGA
jgi:hypothetical protein